MLDIVIKGKKLHRIFKMMLTVGNFLNSGSARGQAFGIRLKSLQKYFDTKDNNGKPVMQTVLQIIRKQEKDAPPPELTKYISELKENTIETELQF